MLNRLFLLFIASAYFTGCSTITERSNHDDRPVILSQPVLQVNVPSPTSGKPQSKIWFHEDSWWALLPTNTGPSLWQRKADGWIEHQEVTRALTGLPGRADVWADGGSVTAVAVERDLLAVYRIEGNQREAKWKTQVLAMLRSPSAASDIETATLARDKKGHWWVAAATGGIVYVWSSPPDGKTWTRPVALADGLNEDDICVVSILPEGIGVFWSDQVLETVNVKVHVDGRPIDEWSDLAVIESGNKTADDHLNTSLSSDGTVWLATKNSVDENGKPLLVLRVRSRDGGWRNYPYGVLEPGRQPSRPAVFTTEDAIVLAGHTIYDTKNSFQGEIVFGQVDTTRESVLSATRTVIVPDTSAWHRGNRINDLTGPKKPFPEDAAWIILASDREGRVYEANLRQLQE